MSKAKQKAPVSFTANIASEYLDAVNGKITKISISEPLPPPPSYFEEDEENPEFFFVRRNKFGSTKQFLKALKPVVFLGRCFGVISRNDVLNKSKSKSKVPFAQIVSTCLTIFLLVNAILMLRLNIIQFQSDNTVLVRTEGFCHSGYAWVLFFVYCYQLFATTKLRDIIQNIIKANEWSHLSNHEGPGTKWFAKFPLSCAIIVAVSLVFGITENILYDIQRVARFTGNGMNYWQLISITNLEKYYLQTFHQWQDVMPSSISPVTMIFAIIIKLCTWGWVYMDSICMVLCRALWTKLQIMDQSLAADLDAAAKTGGKGKAHEQLFIPGKNSRNEKLPPSKLLSRNLDDYQEEYLVITKLVHQVQDYLSPLILGNYFCNVYIMIVMIFHWIGPFASTVKTREQGAYVVFAVLYFCYRVGTLTYFVAEVHQISMSIKEKIQTCPNDQCTIAVHRLEMTLIGNPTGICLFGSFMITRHFFISIIFFMFTSEIILMQAYSGFVDKSSTNSYTPPAQPNWYW